MGAVRIGERGEGDDDKSMEEDYLEWKDGMWEAFATAMSVEEGQGGDSADFAVSELKSHPPEKVYLGEHKIITLPPRLTSLRQVNFPLVLSPRQEVSMMQRIHTLPPFLPLESCSSRLRIVTVSTWS
jgi:hypothetical protein